MLLFLRVHIGAFFDEEPNGFAIAGDGRHHQRSEIIHRFRLWIGARLQQNVHDGGGAALGSHEQRSVAADACGCADISARVDQQLSHLGVTSLGGPMQGGRTITLCAVHIGRLLEQTADGVPVSRVGVAPVASP